MEARLHITLMLASPGGASLEFVGPCQGQLITIFEILFVSLLLVPQVVECACMLGTIMCGAMVFPDCGSWVARV